MPLLGEFGGPPRPTPECGVALQAGCSESNRPQAPESHQVHQNPCLHKPLNDKGSLRYHGRDEICSGMIQTALQFLEGYGVWR